MSRMHRIMYIQILPHLQIILETKYSLSHLNLRVQACLIRRYRIQWRIRLQSVAWPRGPKYFPHTQGWKSWIQEVLEVGKLEIGRLEVGQSHSRTNEQGKIELLSQLMDHGRLRFSTGTTHGILTQIRTQDSEYVFIFSSESCHSYFVITVR